MKEVDLILKDYEFKVPPHQLDCKMDIKSDQEGTIYYIIKKNMNIGV